jgi:hypothetical protein
MRLFLLLSILISTVYASETNTGYFLRLNPSARSMAVGEAGVALENGPLAVYWNPANLKQPKSYEVAIMHANYFISDVNYDFASVSLPYDEATLAFGFSRLAVDDIADSRNALINEGVDWRLDYSKIKYFSTADYVFYASYASQLTDEIRIGFSGKFVYRDFSSESGQGIGFDAGITWEPYQQLKVAAIAQDVTTTPIFYSTDKSEYTLPKLRVGVTYPFYFESIDLTVQPVLQTDMVLEKIPGSLVRTNGFSLDMPSGLELRYSDRFALRGGIDSNQQPTFGAGLRLGGLTLDYAFSPDTQNNLGNINIISAHFDIDRIFN